MNIGYQKKINSDFIQYTPNTTTFNITEYTSKYLNSYPVKGTDSMQFPYELDALCQY